MNEGEFGEKITLVRVAAREGNDTGDECGHFWEQIDGGKRTEQQSDGQAHRKTQRQMDTKTAGAWCKWKKIETGGREVKEGLQWAGHHLARTPPMLLPLENWSANRLKSSKNPTCSGTTMEIWSSGSEQDGLVHFYCLANATQQACLLINLSHCNPIPQ